MHVLSSVMGFTLPALLPRFYTHYFSAVLFVYFGVRLLREGSGMEDGVSEELQEAEEELGVAKDEEGGDGEDGERVNEVHKKEGGMVGLIQQVFPFATPKLITVFIQAFSITFVAEWGDRSQVCNI